MRRAQTWLVRPWQKKGSRRFTILERSEGASRAVKWPELAAINAEYQKGSLTPQEAENACLKLMAAKTERVRGRVAGSGNQAVLDKWWEEERLTRRAENLEGARREYEVALEAIEPLSVLGDGRAIANQLSRRFKHEPQIEYRRALRISELRRGLGLREIPLPAVPRRVPKHLELEQFERLAAALTGETARYVTVLFATGMRPQEAAVVGPDDLIEYPNGALSIVVDKAWKRRHGRLGTTKTGNPRVSAVLGMGHKAIREWVALSIEHRVRLMSGKASEIKMACRRLWPGRPEHQLTWKDFRHCYAIQLVRKGFNLQAIARNLGNGERVCEMYYAGFSPASIEAADYAARVL